MIPHEEGSFLFGGCFGGCWFLSFFWICFRRYCSSDSINDRQTVFGGEVAVSGGHRDCLVPSEFLNLLDGCAVHRQPGTKRMPIRVPYITFDPGIGQTRNKSGVALLISNANPTALYLSC